MNEKEISKNERQKIYDHSPKGIETRKRYWSSQKGKETQKKWIDSPKGKKSQYIRNRRYLDRQKLLEALGPSNRF